MTGKLSSPDDVTVIYRELPVVSEDERAELVGLPPTAEMHAEVLARMPFRDAVEERPAPRPAPLHGRSARIAAWNLERCRFPGASARLLASLEPSAVLLSEMDCGMARTGQRHATRELADPLRGGYVYAVEFLELGLGDERERAAHAGERNRVGYHGGGIVSPHRLARPEVVRLDAGGAWFDGSRGERRVGSRIAVLATLRVGDEDVALASVHLESHGSPDDRATQMRALVEAVERYAPGAPAVIGGDLNSFSLGVEITQPEAVRRALEEDPRRWSHAVPHEPLFEVAREAGFDWRACNVEGEPTLRVVEADKTRRGVFKVDWLLCRGVEASEPRVVDAVDLDTGRALSDHEIVTATIHTIVR